MENKQKQNLPADTTESKCKGFYSTSGTLLLIGDHDRLYPPKALERARRVIPNLEGEIIPQAGHFMNLEQQVLVNKHVLAFLKEPVLHNNHG
jgi:hypothetical protein